MRTRIQSQRETPPIPAALAYHAESLPNASAIFSVSALADREDILGTLFGNDDFAQYLQLSVRLPDPAAAGFLPLNPMHFSTAQAPTGATAMTPDLAFNTAVSFVTNTNWQSYSPDTTMSYLTQMAALAVQNFVSAAVGIALAVALIRGFARHTTKSIGNFWADVVRCTVYVLLPKPALGFIGERGVNVLLLNVALDQKFPPRK